MQPTFANFKNLFRQCEIELTPPQYERFWAFHQYLKEQSKNMDLTRIRRFEDLVIKHYVDCTLVLKWVQLTSPVLDLGTGAGFPGIPIKILNPDLEMILAESRAYRVTFLQNVCRVLGLEKTRVYPHKISSTFPEAVNTVITRAFERIGETLQRVGGFLREGGHVIFMKGPSCNNEIKEATQRFKLEYLLVDEIAYTIPSTKHRRRLVIFQRTYELMTYSQKNKSDPHSIHGGKQMQSATRIKEISSQANEAFKMFQKILSGKGIKKHRMALVSGTKQIHDILNDIPEKCLGWLMPAKSKDLPQNLPEYITVYQLHPELFRQLDLFGTKRPILQVQVDPLLAWQAEKPWPRGCTLFLACQDPDNVGAVIRSAAAFNVAQIVILREAANPFHPKSIRVAGSALFRIPILEGPSIHEIHVTRMPLIGLSPNGKDVADFQFPKTFGLVPGLEGQGLPETLRKSTTLSIPMTKKVESLNTAVAAAVVLYEWNRQAGKGNKG